MNDNDSQDTYLPMSVIDRLSQEDYAMFLSYGDAALDVQPKPTTRNEDLVCNSILDTTMSQDTMLGSNHTTLPTVISVPPTTFISLD